MEKKDLIIIIQARMNSKRLPGKVLKKINKKTVLENIIFRLKNLNYTIVVATTNNLKDKKIIDLCKKQKIKFFKGNEKDVLSRFYCCASQLKAKSIIRITADCPLIDYKIIKKLIYQYKKYNYDHIGLATGAGVKDINCNKFPDGLDAECFNFKSLENAHYFAKNKFDREHVTPYIWKNKKKFKVGYLESAKDYSNLRLTLDNLEDLRLIRIIYKKIKRKMFFLDDVVKLFKEKPKIFNLNKHYIGNEKY